MKIASIILCFTLLYSTYAQSRIGGSGYKIPPKHKILKNYSSRNNTALLDQQFNMLVWNLYKGDYPDFSTEISKVINEYDIQLYQEATTEPEVIGPLTSGNYDSYMGTSFIFKDGFTETGVLTRSKVKTENVVALHPFGREPVINTPKATMLTWYKTINEGETLLVANIHAINFVLIDIFSAHIRELYQILKKHNGPMIFAGDFNTWAPNRMIFLYRMMKELKLKAVKWTPDHRKRFAGSPLDHVFYRDLKVISSKSWENPGSDHTPMEVRFEQISK